MRRSVPAARARDTRLPVPAYFLYGEPVEVPGEHTVHVETIAARSALHEWHIRAHRHVDLQQVLYVRRGSVEAAIDAVTDRLRAPLALVIPPGCVHGFRFEPQTQGIVISFAVELPAGLLGVSPGLLELLQLAGAYRLDRPAVQATDLDALAAMLLREFERSAPGRDTALKGLLATFLANLLRLVEGARQSTDATRSRDQEIVARYRQLIERTYRSRTSVAAHARTLGLSESSLRRACLAAAGVSPLELQHARRLVEAMRQLRYTSMSVAEVGFYLGFDDPAYFSRFFTHRTGTSPRAFRSRHTTR